MSIVFQGMCHAKLQKAVGGGGLQVRSCFPLYPSIIFCRQLTTRISRVEHTLRLYKHQLAFLFSNRPVLNSFRNDEHFSRF